MAESQPHPNATGNLPNMFPNQATITNYMRPAMLTAEEAHVQIQLMKQERIAAVKKLRDMQRALEQKDKALEEKDRALVEKDKQLIDVTLKRLGDAEKGFDLVEADATIDELVRAARLDPNPERYLQAKRIMRQGQRRRTRWRRVVNRITQV